MPTRKNVAKRVTQAELRESFWAASPDVLLSRKITAAGMSRSVGWMELKARTGDGIPFIKTGKRVLYRKADAVAWLAKNSQRVTSTAEYKGASV